MDKEYTKVVYKTKPIGKEKIVLYLTTIDIKKVKKENKEQEHQIFKNYFGIKSPSVTIENKGWVTWGTVDLRSDKE